MKQVTDYSSDYLSLFYHVFESNKRVLNITKLQTKTLDLVCLNVFIILNFILILDKNEFYNNLYYQVMWFWQK